MDKFFNYIWSFRKKSHYLCFPLPQNLQSFIYLISVEVNQFIERRSETSSSKERIPYQLLNRLFKNGIESDELVTLDLISSLDRPIQIEGSKNEKSKRTSKKKRTKRNPKPKEVVFSSVIEMPTLLRDRILEIGGFDIKIVTQMQIPETKFEKLYDGLLIPPKKLLNNDFVTIEEKKILNYEDEDLMNKNENGMKVLIIDPLLRESVIEFQMVIIKNYEI